jgi:hypothetical protein
MKWNILAASTRVKKGLIKVTIRKITIRREIMSY